MKREKPIERCVIACGCTDKLARTIHEEMPSIARTLEIGTVRETAARNESTSIVRFLLERSTGACVATVVDPKRRRSPVLASLCPPPFHTAARRMHRVSPIELAYDDESFNVASPQRWDRYLSSCRNRSANKGDTAFLLFNDTLSVQWKFIDFLLSWLEFHCCNNNFIIQWHLFNLK